MKSKMYEKKSAAEREDKLKISAVDVESFTYNKDLTKTELVAFKDSIANLLVELLDLEEELAQIKKEFGENITPVKTELKRITKILKHRKMVVTEKCYKLIEVEEKRVGYYNEDGLLVFERDCDESEMQLKLV